MESGLPEAFSALLENIRLQGLPMIKKHRQKIHSVHTSTTTIPSTHAKNNISKEYNDYNDGSFYSKRTQRHNFNSLDPASRNNHLSENQQKTDPLPYGDHNHRHRNGHHPHTHKYHEISHGNLFKFDKAPQEKENAVIAEAFDFAALFL